MAPAASERIAERQVEKARVVSANGLQRAALIHIHGAAIDQHMPARLPCNIHRELAAAVLAGAARGAGNRDARRGVDRVVRGCPPDEVTGEGQLDAGRGNQRQRRLDIQHVGGADQAGLIEVGLLRYWPAFTVV